MRELYVFCEGQTEQAFCARVLQPHFFPNHDGLVHPLRIAHKRKKGIVYRGGVNKYQIIKDDIVRMLRGQRRAGVLFTSLIDLYALPGDFPGKMAANYSPDNPRPYVETIEEAFGTDINDPRFIPHLQLHEFETLIFAKPEVLAQSYDDVNAQIRELQKVAELYVDIEKINCTPAGAPSKRIIAAIPQYEYDKTTVGPDVTETIGMAAMTTACSHFRAWVGTIAQRLESIDG